MSIIKNQGKIRKFRAISENIKNTFIIKYNDKLNVFIPKRILFMNSSVLTTQNAFIHQKKREDNIYGVVSMTKDSVQDNFSLV